MKLKFQSIQRTALRELPFRKCYELDLVLISFRPVDSLRRTKSESFISINISIKIPIAMLIVQTLIAINDKKFEFIVYDTISFDLSGTSTIIRFD